MLTQRGTTRGFIKYSISMEPFSKDGFSFSIRNKWKAVKKRVVLKAYNLFKFNPFHLQEEGDLVISLFFHRLAVT